MFHESEGPKKLVVVVLMFLLYSVTKSVTQLLTTQLNRIDHYWVGTYFQ